MFPLICTIIGYALLAGSFMCVGMAIALRFVRINNTPDRDADTLPAPPPVPSEFGRGKWTVLP